MLAIYAFYANFNSRERATLFRTLSEVEGPSLYPERSRRVFYTSSRKSEVCPIPYALCPIPYALFPETNNKL